MRSGRVLFGALMFLVAFERPLWGQSAAEAAAPSELRPGDSIVITVWQRPELSGDFDIASDGTILHPLYREIRVTDVPVEQVEERLRTFLTRLEAEPHFVVQPLLTVSVIGAVGQPDVYHLAPGTTVTQAVAAAGGVSETGNSDDVRVVRSGVETRIDLAERGALMTIRSGDEITVKRKGEGFVRGFFLPFMSFVGSVASIVSIATR